MHVALLAVSSWFRPGGRHVRESVLSGRGTKGGNGQVITTMSLPYPLVSTLAGPSPAGATLQVHCFRVMRSDQRGIQLFAGPVPQVSPLNRVTVSEVGGGGC